MEALSHLQAEFNASFPDMVVLLVDMTRIEFDLRGGSCCFMYNYLSRIAYLSSIKSAHTTSILIIRLINEVSLMKTNKQKHHWLIDAALFIGFLLSFWLELTGVALHQWLGVAIGVVAGYHLLTHGTWVKSVTNRFFKQTSSQARLYYVVDATVLIGLATIIVTGLVISTWFDLKLATYSTWKTIHVIASIGTLAAVVIKLGLHWRWIVATARRYIFLQPQQTTPAATGMGRREFLRLMGGVSAVAVIAGGSALNALAQTAATTASTAAPSTQSKTANQSSGTVNTQPQSTSGGTTSTQSQSASTCTVQCQKGCSYPGHCRRYTDSNNNGRCDFGECV